MSIQLFLKDILSLEEDKANEEEIVESIRKGVVFKGTNLWTLIFSIFIASIGLNVNSTAVIIGAMLISPLMGPIMGIGMGIGIYDFELIKKSIKNLSIAVIISIFVSTIYFIFTPLKEAQSEILARTTPVLWDVFIAFFGGLAGIVAGSRKDKGNSIPGVAIATALMPPLCTASYGLATLNFTYFAGAFYLFFINSVFISFSTFLIVRLLKYKRKTFLNSDKEKKVKNYILIFVFITVLPSLYSAKIMVNQVYFETKASAFIKKEFQDLNIQIIEKKIIFKTKKIEIFYLGDTLPDTEISRITAKLSDYNIYKTTLSVKQIFDIEKGMAKNIQNVKESVIEELYNKTRNTLDNKDKEIALLTKKISDYEKKALLQLSLSDELKVFYPELTDFDILAGNNKFVLLLNQKISLTLKDEIRIKKWISNKSGLAEENVEIIKKLP